MEIYIRYNSAWNFRKTFAERYLGDSVKKYGNLFDTVSCYWSGRRISNQCAVAEITYISLKEKAPDLMEAMSDHTDVTRSKLVINEIRRLLNLEEDYFDRWQ